MEAQEIKMFRDDSRGFIRGSVIPDRYGEIPVCLRPQTLEAGFQVLSRVVRNDADKHPRGAHALASRSCEICRAAPQNILAESIRDRLGTGDIASDTALRRKSPNSINRFTRDAAVGP